jgi:hypothetical protein
MKWLRGIRGAIAMGLAWAIAWGSAGLLIELFWELVPGFPLGQLVGYLAEAVTIPGFLAGVIFYGVLRVAAGDRRFDELSLLRCAASGAMSGLVVGVSLISAGFASTSSIFLLVLMAAVFLASPTLLSVISACAWFVLVRIAKHFRGDILETATK